MRGAKFWESWENTKYPEIEQTEDQNGYGQGVSDKAAESCA